MVVSRPFVTIHVMLQPLHRTPGLCPAQSRACIVLRAEVDADTVDTVPLILGVSKPLALEDVAQVSSTVVAYNLGPHHAEAGVGLLPNGAWHGVPECRPPASRIELVVRLVQWCVAAGASVDAGIGVVLVEGAGAGHFGALLAEDAKLLCHVVSRYATAWMQCEADLATAAPATRPRSSAPGSLSGPPCCWMIRKARPGRGCWA
jgi:hypothetical protein